MPGSASQGALLNFGLSALPCPQLATRHVQAAKRSLLYTAAVRSTPLPIMLIVWLRLVAAVMYSMMVTAPQVLPAGTALPVEVGATLSAKNARAGQKIEGRLMQEVRLPSGFVIKKGSRISGKIISVQRPSGITLRFDQLQDEHQAIPLNVSLRAIADSASVFQAALPVDASTSEASDEWVTQQIGGDYVFRGRGYVSSDQGQVGRWTGTGVWGKLGPGGDCIDSDDNGDEQALWIFSGTACGAYGFQDLTIAKSGRTPPVGEITLRSSKQALVRGGGGWLLVVNSAAIGAVNRKQ